METAANTAANAATLAANTAAATAAGVTTAASSAANSVFKALGATALNVINSAKSVAKTATNEFQSVKDAANAPATGGGRRKKKIGGTVTGGCNDPGCIANCTCMAPKCEPGACRTCSVGCPGHITNDSKEESPPSIDRNLLHNKCATCAKSCECLDGENCKHGECTTCSRACACSSRNPINAASQSAKTGGGKSRSKSRSKSRGKSKGKSRSKSRSKSRGKSKSRK